jgi:Domain of unknown function (DUF4157)
MNHQSATQEHQATPAARVLADSVLQRSCDCGQHTIAGGQCAKCQSRQQSLQRIRGSQELETRHHAEAPSIVHEVLSSPGQPLDAESRAFFEPRFGHDFSDVRVHTNERAAKSAEAVHSLAYTVGSNVVFDKGCSCQPVTGVQVGKDCKATGRAGFGPRGGG